MFRMLRPVCLMVTLLSLTCTSYGAEKLKNGDVLLYSDQAGQGFIFSEKQTKNRFFKDFLQWAQKDMGNVPAQDSWLFVGSSSMRMWRSVKKDMAPLKVLHRGFGGSTMWDVVAFKNFLARYQAKSIVVYEGDNDLCNKKEDSVEKFLKNCRDFAACIHEAQPDTSIYFISPKPSISRLGYEDKYEAGRKGLQALARENPKVFYIDVATPMLGEDGKPKADIFKRDKLHMNEKGYAIWTKVVRKALGLKPLGE